MTIPIQQEEENYTTHIETRVHAGVIVHRIKFLTEAQQSVKELRESVDYDDEPRGLADWHNDYQSDPANGREF